MTPPEPTHLLPSELLARLDAIGIAHTTFEHPPVYTVAEAKALRGEIVGAHVKNLFLRNKKGRMWVVTMLEDRQLDLKALGKRLQAGSGGVSFASHERLERYLGVIPGSVTPLAAINDHEGAVDIVLDTGMDRFELVNVHPLVNSMTTALSPDDLRRFLVDCGHPAQMLDLDEVAVP